MKTISITNWTDLNKGSLAFYTGKWFLVWSFKLWCVGIIAACTLLAFFLACFSEAKEKS